MLARVLQGTIHIYLDESGDLGFGTGGSRFFVVAALAISDARTLERLIKKENRRLKSKGARPIEHKFNKSSEAVRFRMLHGVSETDSLISWRAIDKNKTNVHFRKDRDELYQWLCAEVLSDIIPHRVKTGVVIHLDRMASKKGVRESMSAYLSSRIIRDRTGFSTFFTIEHQVSYNVAGLQVVDFIAGSVFQYLEREFPDYYQIIEKNVIYGIKIN